jgi:hypothetical protein
VTSPCSGGRLHFREVVSSHASPAGVVSIDENPRTRSLPRVRAVGLDGWMQSHRLHDSNFYRRIPVRGAVRARVRMRPSQGIRWGAGLHEVLRRRPTARERPLPRADDRLRALRYRALVRGHEDVARRSSTSRVRGGTKGGVRVRATRGDPHDTLPVLMRGSPLCRDGTVEPSAALPPARVSEVGPRRAGEKNKGPRPIGPDAWSRCGLTAGRFLDAAAAPGKRAPWTAAPRSRNKRELPLQKGRGDPPEASAACRKVTATPQRHSQHAEGGADSPQTLPQRVKGSGRLGGGFRSVAKGAGARGGPFCSVAKGWLRK